MEIDLSKQGTEHMQKRTLLFSTKLKIFRISWIFFNFLFYCNFGYNQRFSPMKMGSVETNLTARKFTRCGFFSVRLRRSYFPLHDLSLISLTHWHIDSAIRKIKFHHQSNNDLIYFLWFKIRDLGRLDVKSRYCHLGPTAPQEAIPSSSTSVKIVSPDHYYTINASEQNRRQINGKEQNRVYLGQPKTEIRIEIQKYRKNTKLTWHHNFGYFWCQ